MNIIIILIERKIKKKRFQLWRTFFEKGHF